jgi:hypothetical protein
MNGMMPAKSVDPDGGIPCNQVIVRYSPNFTPMSGSDLRTSLTDAQKNLLSSDSLVTQTTVDPSVTTAHPFTQPRYVDTLMVNKADADAEATRLQALYGVQRYWLTIPMFLDDVNLLTEMGEEDDVASDRHFLGAGTRVAILGITPDVSNVQTTLAAFF